MGLKLKVNRNFLHLATARVQGSINDRGLAQIGLKVAGGKLSVSAADSVLAVYTACACEALVEGSVFVPARIFSEIVRELPEGLIKLEAMASQLVITAGAREEFLMKIPLIENAVWREPPVFDTDNSADLPAVKLTYMVEQVQFCVSQESSRNYGTVGFLHRPDKETIRLVGTDGFRLSYCEVGTAMPDGFLENGVALSKRALNEILRMCSEGFESVHLAISGDQTALVAQVTDYQIFVRLSAVKYPNYAGVIPAARQSRVMVSRSQLQNVARRVLLAADKSHALQLSFSDSSLTLASKTMGSSEGKESVLLDDYHGPRCDLAVNGKFLTDIFSTTPSEKLTLQFKDVEEPMVIVPRDEPTDCRSKHVLVPIRESE